LRSAVLNSYYSVFINIYNVNTSDMMIANQNENNLDAAWTVIEAG